MFGFHAITITLHSERIVENPDITPKLDYFRRSGTMCRRSLGTVSWSTTFAKMLYRIAVATIEVRFLIWRLSARCLQMNSLSRLE